MRDEALARKEPLHVVGDLGEDAMNVAPAEGCVRILDYLYVLVF